jgi:hypothetical protein
MKIQSRPVFIGQATKTTTPTLIQCPSYTIIPTIQIWQQIPASMGKCSLTWTCVGCHSHYSYHFGVISSSMSLELTTPSGWHPMSNSSGSTSSIHSMAAAKNGSLRII